MSRIDELRLITKVARLYYEYGLRQNAIVERLGLSQSTVSRLLKRARQENIVRVSVVVPRGVHTALEERLEQEYSLNEAIVVDVDDADSAEHRVLLDIGSAAAAYVEAILQPGEVVGISSWSRALLAMMETMKRLPKPTQARVVQILGGIGDPTKDAHASVLTREFAALIRAEATYLPAPGVVRSKESRRYFMEDKFVRRAIELFSQISLALVGIGTVGPPYNPSSSAVVFSDKELLQARKQGAVGDICLRFFDGRGAPVLTRLDRSVIGIELEQLKKVKRSIAVAGGPSKVPAILGALRGGWVNGLITDRFTAEALLEDHQAGAAGR